MIEIQVGSVEMKEQTIEALRGGVMKEQWSPLIHGMGNKELNQSSRAARLPLVRLWFRWEASRRECV